MFMRGGSGRSTGSTSRSPSLREIDEEAALVDDGGGKLYVALGKDLKDSKSNLSAVRSLSLLGDLKLVLLHVHQPAERIMSGKASTLFPATAVFFGSLVDRDLFANIVQVNPYSALKRQYGLVSFLNL
jgi:hypothetical protein